MNYPLANPGVFKTLQGEGSLLGIPMTFVRLGGCSIGCPGCDTNYRVAERATVADIVQRVQQHQTAWTWVTGGEPADHELTSLLEGLRLCGRVAVATSGHKSLGVSSRLIDFLSISPHGKPADLVLTNTPGASINLVPGLNGLDLKDWTRFDPSGFGSAWVTPSWYDRGDRAEGVRECIEFVQSHPGWRLGIQAHKSWGVA